MPVPANDPTGLRFGEVASLYEQGRPDYPAEAVDALLPGGVDVVVDVGAGTGKLTRAIIRVARTVIAVEPDDAMRAVLAALVPTATPLAGTAEDLPLADGSADAVVAGQAWHWVDPNRAVREVARVLRPDGALGLVWNDRDEDDAWVAELSALLTQYGTTPDADYEPSVGPPFGPFDRSEFRWVNHVTVDDAIAMITSRSYVIALPADQHAELVRRMRGLALSAVEQSTGLLPVPYVTRTYRATLSS